MPDRINIGQNVNEKATPVLQFRFVDEDDIAVSVSDFTTLTLTYYTASGGSAINSRTDQDVLNANNCTLDDNGLFSWSMVTADTAILDTTIAIDATEGRIALFEWTWDSGNRFGSQEFLFYVIQQNKVP